MCATITDHREAVTGWSFKSGRLKVNATDYANPENHELAQHIGRRDKMMSTLPVNAHFSPANTQSILKTCHCHLPLDSYETNCWLSNSKNPSISYLYKNAIAQRAHLQPQFIITSC